MPPVRPTPPHMVRTPLWVTILLAALAGGGGVLISQPSTPTPVADPVTQTTSVSTPAAPVVAPTVVTPSWEGIPVTVVCPLSTDDTSLRDACPEYFTSSWQTAAVRDGYTSGSQKLAKVDCAMDHLSQLDLVTQQSLTCRDGLNAAIYGQDGSGGGKCAADIATYCQGVHPTPGSNPTDLCLQLVVTDGNPATQLSALCATAVANHKYAEDQVKAR